MISIALEMEAWLAQTGSLPQNRRSVCSASETEWLELAIALRDGQVLCRLMGFLVPGSIGDSVFACGSQLSQESCERNIRLFLTVCKNYFHMEDDELFEPDDLLTYQMFGKVFVTLSLLSQSAESMRNNLKPFPSEVALRSYLASSSPGNPGAKAARVATADDISLEEIYAHVDQELYDHAEGVHLMSEMADEENVYSKMQDIYDDVCSYRRSTDLASQIVVPPATYHSVNELIDKEETFILALRRIEDEFRMPLTGYLSVERRRVIFLKMEDFIRVHSAFLADLRAACSSSSSCIRLLSEAFLKRRNEFAVTYAPYVENLARSLDLLKQVRNDKNAARQLAACEETTRDGYYPLEERIRLPILRFVKMLPLYESIMSAVPPDDEDRQYIESACKSIKELNQFLDSIKAESDENRAGRILKEQLVFDRVRCQLQDSPLKYRLFHKGNILSTDKTKKPLSRLLFILGSSLLICEPFGESKYRCLEVEPLANRCVESGDAENVWHLIDTLTGQVENKFTCTNFQEAEEMMRDAQRAIKCLNEWVQPSFRRQGGHRLLATDFGSGSVCTLCDGFFQGAAGRGMECMECGQRCHFRCVDTDRLPDCLDAGGTGETATHELPSAVEEEIKTKSWFGSVFTKRDDVVNVMGLNFIRPGTWVARTTERKAGIIFSIKTSAGTIKHLRLAYMKHGTTGAKGTAAASFCLSNASFGFASVDDMVMWCQVNSLEAIFPTVTEMHLKLGLACSEIMSRRQGVQRKVAVHPNTSTHH